MLDARGRYHTKHLKWVEPQRDECVSRRKVVAHWKAQGDRDFPSVFVELTRVAEKVAQRARSDRWQIAMEKKKEASYQGGDAESVVSSSEAVSRKKALRPV
jgi:hypothetical protein